MKNLLEHPATLLILILVIVLLLGWKRLPDMARSLGRSSRILKSEVSELKHDTRKDEKPLNDSVAEPVVERHEHHVTTQAVPVTENSTSVSSSGPIEAPEPIDAPQPIVRSQSAGAERLRGYARKGSDLVDQGKDAARDLKGLADEIPGAHKLGAASGQSTEDAAAHNAAARRYH